MTKSLPTKTCPLIPNALYVASLRLHMGKRKPHSRDSAYYALRLCVYVLLCAQGMLAVIHAGHFKLK